MNKLDFLNEIDRVLAFYQRPDEAKQPGEAKDYQIWLEEIFKKVSWIESIKFRLVVDALLDVRPRFRKDLDHRKILEVYHGLAELNGWKRALERNCPDCKGIRFFHIWLRDKKGAEFPAVKGCSNCNPRVAGIHPDFTEIQGPTFEKINDDIDRLRRIPPAFAGCLLDIADAAGFKPKQSIVDALVEARCQPEPKVAYQKFNPVIRKNEMVRALIEAPPVKVIEAGTAEEEPATTEPPPAPVEQPSPAPVTEEEEAPPAVAHIPKERRKILAEEAEAEGVPF